MQSKWQILFQCNAESEDADANIITRRKSNCSVSWVLINAPITTCQVIQTFPFSGFGKWQHAVICVKLDAQSEGERYFCKSVAPARNLQIWINIMQHFSFFLLEGLLHIILQQDL